MVHVLAASLSTPSPTSGWVYFLLGLTVGILVMAKIVHGK